MKLEEDLGFGSGTIAKWDKASPKAENVAKVADYFGVSIDYILLRDTDTPTVPPDILALAEQIQGLPPEARELVEKQVKIFSDMDKK